MSMDFEKIVDTYEPTPHDTLYIWVGMHTRMWWATTNMESHPNQTTSSLNIWVGQCSGTLSGITGRILDGSHYAQVERRSVTFPNQTMSRGEAFGLKNCIEIISI